MLLLLLSILYLSILLLKNFQCTFNLLEKWNRDKPKELQLLKFAVFKIGLRYRILSRCVRLINTVWSLLSVDIYLRQTLLLCIASLFLNDLFTRSWSNHFLQEHTMAHHLTCVIYSSHSAHFMKNILPRSIRFPSICLTFQLTFFSLIDVA